jgi:hypothetical protein
MPIAACAPRVEELSTRREELEAHSKHLGEMLKYSIPRIPTREEVATLRSGVADVIAYGKPALKKELFDDLLVDVQIHPGQNAYPRFKVPDVDHPGPFVAKTLNRTKVSSEYQIVEVSGLEAPTSQLRTCSICPSDQALAERTYWYARCVPLTLPQISSNPAR